MYLQYTTVHSVWTKHIYIYIQIYIENYDNNNNNNYNNDDDDDGDERVFVEKPENNESNI